MNRVEGTADVKLLECTNPAKDKWRIRWDIQEQENGDVNYMEEEFDHKPSKDEIRHTVINWINSHTDNIILSGFVWNGMNVWLSQENQFNYKVAYDLAVQTLGASLPVTFKFGTDDEPCYYKFSSIEQLKDFYTKCVAHIQTTLEECWKIKDSFKLDLYQ